MAAHSFHVTWYATALRGDDLQAALEQVSEIAPRYGASSWSVHRSTEDRYRFLQIVTFSDKDDFQAYYYGPEFREMRAAMSGAFQNPVAYVPFDVIVDAAQVTA